MTATTALLTVSATRASLHELGRRWWIPLLSGLVWFVLAWLLLSFDVKTVWTVAIFTAIFLMYGGAIELILASLAPSWRWLHLLLGILFIVGGFVALLWPDATFLALAAVISWVIMVCGVIDIVTSLMFQSVHDLWLLQLIVGIAEVGIAAWAIGYAGRSIVLMVVWLAAIAIARGIIHIVLAFQVRRLRDLWSDGAMPEGGARA